jgi:hypothetical protein
MPRELGHIVFGERLRMSKINPRHIAACLIFALHTLIAGVYVAERWHDLRGPPIKSPREHVAEGGMFCNSITYYDSAADAARGVRRDLDYAAKYASKVEITPKLNWVGFKVGERILTVYPPRESHKGMASIQWAEGARVRSICTSDLQLALEYEREANRWFSRFPEF